MKNVSLYIDLAFCMVVLPVMIMIFPVERWFHNFQWYVVLVVGWLYCLYFINRFVTVPYLFKSKQYVIVGVLTIVLSGVVTYCISRVTLYTPKPNIHDEGVGRLLPYIQQYRQAVWSLFMIVVAFSYAVGLLTQANIQRSRRRAVEAERDKGEIELYKAQIKPHFMFNTLNSIYGLFLTKDDNALASLEKFISMMRYIHTTSRSEMVRLSEEVDYINQYVGLQILRLNDKTTVNLNTDIDDVAHMIPPMLLVTFVENCFKHGVSSVDEAMIDISMRERGGRLVFQTCNRVFPAKRIGEHMGIENCKKRLELLYPGRHELMVENDGCLFKVKLSIILTA